MTEYNVYFRGRSTDFMLRLGVIPSRKGTQFTDTILLLSDCSIEMRRHTLLDEVDNYTLGEINESPMYDLDYTVIV